MNTPLSANKVDQLQLQSTLELLEAKSRATCEQAELEFMVVNESIGLCHYRQAVFWREQNGVRRLSGVVQIEANAPYVQWIGRLCEFLNEKYADTVSLQQNALPKSLANEWTVWLPQHIIWIPLTEPVISRKEGAAGLLFANETGFSQRQAELLTRWCDKWYYNWTASRQISTGKWLKRVSIGVQDSKKSWWQQPYLYAIFAILLFLQLPVDLTVLAPAELIPKDPIVIRSPMDGVIDEVFVVPNSQVEPGTLLFNLDQEKLYSQFEIAQSKLAGLKTQYNQVTQLSLMDGLQKAKLSTIAAEIEQKTVEIQYLQEQLQHSEVKADTTGTVLFQAADELEGKPVQTGEGIMRLVNPENVQVEAWLGVADAVPISDGAKLQLYLSSIPTHPVSARVFLMGYEPMRQPSGQYAYCIRAEIQDVQAHRVGLKGVAKIVADEVPLYYWLFRRPMAAVRQFLGI